MPVSEKEFRMLFLQVLESKVGLFCVLWINGGRLLSHNLFFAQHLAGHIKSFLHYVNGPHSNQ